MHILDLITLRYTVTPVLFNTLFLMLIFTKLLNLLVYNQYFIQPNDTTEISPKDIDQLARTSFPLCMRHMLEKVRHLKSYVHGLPFDQVI